MHAAVYSPPSIEEVHSDHVHFSICTTDLAVLQYSLAVTSYTPSVTHTYTRTLLQSSYMHAAVYSPPLLPCRVHPSICTTNPAVLQYSLTVISHIKAHNTLTPCWSTAIIMTKLSFAFHRRGTTMLYCILLLARLT